MKKGYLIVLRDMRETEKWVETDDQNSVDMLGVYLDALEYAGVLDHVEEL
jgi:hypothetical protein